MKKWMILGITVLGAYGGQAYAGSGTDGNQFIQDCRKAIDFIDSKPVGDQASYLEAGTCIGIANGVITAAMVTETTPPGPNQMCLPETISPYQAVRIADKYMTDHPEKLGYANGSIMYAALLNAFPCRKLR